jgi:hypothetical protein
MARHPSWRRLATWSTLTDEEAAQRRRARVVKDREKPQMGFLFYANFVRLVLRGELTLVLLERARAFMRAAGVGPEAGQ